MEVKAFIFDLDGVITDTARYHYLAWKKLADSLGYHFDEEVNERLKGVSRMHSFEIILEENNALDKYSVEEREKLANQKNDLYVDLIKSVTNEDILPGINELLEKCKENGIKCAVASASKNAFSVLENLGIKEKFDYIADANLIKNTKPDPEVFLDCANALSLKPEECICFEDAEAGIEAISRANMMSVGINVKSDEFKADLDFKSTKDLDFDTIIKKYRELH